jgi:hypothetical protein
LTFQSNRGIFTPSYKSQSHKPPKREPEYPESKEPSHDAYRDAGKGDADFRSGLAMKPGGSCGRARKTGIER